MQLPKTLESNCFYGEPVVRPEGCKIDCSLQVGDMGIFNQNTFDDLVLPSQHKFFRGNHDNPKLCQKHSNHLGDWGYIPEMEMFWVGGGFSIDWKYRTPDLTWWRDEELDYSILLDVIEKFSDTKPKIMVTHECPTYIKHYALTNYDKSYAVSRTESALQTMFENHKPEIWIFGHHHKKIDVTITQDDGITRFICLNGFLCKRQNMGEMYFEIPGLEWSSTSPD